MIVFTCFFLAEFISRAAVAAAAMLEWIIWYVSLKFSRSWENEEEHKGEGAQKPTGLIQILFKL